jgi:SOS response regulatory protein OraA/RecX
MADESDVLECALRSLRHRDRSVRELEQRLELRGFSESERGHAIETLLRTGLVDDRRFAEARACSLAERGASDVLIRHTLGLAGVSSELVEEALQDVLPEAERVRHIVSRRGSGPRTARYLLGKGFSEEVVDGLLGE